MHLAVQIQPIQHSHHSLLLTFAPLLSLKQINQNKFVVTASLPFSLDLHHNNRLPQVINGLESFEIPYIDTSSLIILEAC